MTAQNTSSAVMAQRVEAHDSLDHFPTPPWATRALCEWIASHDDRLCIFQTALEPACAEGHMVKALAEYFSTVDGSDVHDYGFGCVRDFLWIEDLYGSYDWSITNPPFRLADQFATKALKLAGRGVALLVRTAFLEGGERYRTLFCKTPPSDILQFCERVPMFKGRLDRKGSTATAYCWLVWRKRAPHGTHFHWIAPCRKRLERDSDYPSEVAP